MSYVIYRYRYLAAFTTIGMLSIVLEIILTGYVLPTQWPIYLRAGLAFVLGMLFSFVFNATLNFRVPWPYLLHTFWRFALVSTFSFGLNMAAVHSFYYWFDSSYGACRLVSSSILFSIAYWLHRRFTFDRTHSFGIAVYASASERVSRIFHRVGRTCNHLHVDLVDKTMFGAAEPVDLAQLCRARRMWPNTPVCLHVMSLYPRHWAEQTWAEVDWYLFHLNAHDDLRSLILECRLRGKRVGIVWHNSVDIGLMLPLLAHVDFAMVLGISQPGQSGQPILEEAIAMADMLDGLRERYGFEVMFDGGVNATTITRIRAKYVVAASAVLRAKSPILFTHCLQTGGKYESRVA